MRGRRGALALHFLFAALAWSPGAEAALNPRTADVAARELVKEQGYSFCESPPRVLSIRARELCSLAEKADGCEALVKKCAAAEPEEKPSAFWQRVAAFILKIAPYIAWTVVGVLVLLVVYLIGRAIRAAKDDVVSIEPASRKEDVLVVEDDAPEVATAAELLLRRAAELHARGDERAALFTYLAAALRALDDRGAVRIARGIVRTGSTSAPVVRLRRDRRFGEIAREVDLVQFGGTDASADAVGRAATRAEAIVHAVPSTPPRVPAAMTGILGVLGLVLFATACDGRPGSRSDPAGRGLLVDLLTKQGAHVKTLPGSLATLPMDGRSGPVIILDAHRVPLEDETRQHLVAWVKQGGTLVLAGSPRLWPADFWAKPAESADTGAGEVDASHSKETCAVDPADRPLARIVRVETRGAVTTPAANDDDDDIPESAPRVDHATLASFAAMTWPSDDNSPRTVARFEGGELYAALRVFGEGKILGLANADLFTNLSLVVPGNAAAIIAMLETLGKDEFAVARAEQGISPPSNPFAGLLRIGLGLALLHAVVFIPLLFVAFGARQVAPMPEPPPRRRAFAEHVRAVGALYARRRAAGHALAVFAKYVDDRVRRRMPRGSDPSQFLAARSGENAAETAELYARALAAAAGAPPRGDDLAVLDRLSVLYTKAMAS